MKIVCISMYNKAIEVSVKPDTAMLVNKKPLFVPNFTTDMRAIPCILLRVSRLGRNIAERFAYRYYNAQTIGLDFMAFDCMQEARLSGMSLSPWVAFDGSLAIGKWDEGQELMPKVSMLLNNDNVWDSEQSRWACDASQAIALASSYFKLAQGDIIAIGAVTEPVKLEINDHIDITDGKDMILQMNIK